jgi:hypothetical protein
MSFFQFYQRCLPARNVSVIYEIADIQLVDSGE